MENAGFKLKILLFNCFLLKALSEKCDTPNGEEAECVPIRSCPILFNAVTSLEPEAIEFVKKSHCGYVGKDPLVCCGSSAAYHITSSATTSGITKATTAAPYNIQEKMDLLPSRIYCGYQRFDDYFHLENDTVAPSIDEFPWVVALMYKNDSNSRCVGSLISDRYVLTSASCIMDVKVLVRARLGEYNIAKEQDCISTRQFSDECADPVADYGIEESTVHPGYKRSDDYQHNIGLIRLNRRVTYSDFIRPICLPFPGTKFAQIGESLYQTGWGADLVLNPVDVKKKFAVELLPNERCVEEYEDANVTITDNYTCTLEHSSSVQVSCSGDGGGPVMFFNSKNQWHQEGIVSFGRLCLLRAPSVNIRVVKYLDWILANIRP